MKKTMRKYKIVFPILVLTYLNFYFLSPFIHEHTLELAGQVETENTLHSHLMGINNLNSNNADYLSYAVTSHTHNYSFDIPIIIQSSQKFISIFSNSTICQKEKYQNEYESIIDIINITRSQNQISWERYVHFATNSSPPVLTT